MLTHLWVLLYWSMAVSTPTAGTDVFAQVYQSSSSALAVAAESNNNCVVLHDGKEYRVVKKTVEAHLVPDPYPYEYDGFHVGECVRRRDNPFIFSRVVLLPGMEEYDQLFALDKDAFVLSNDDWEYRKDWEHCK